MKITVYYNKNLKMSEGKLAAQVGHVCLKLGWVQEAVLLGSDSPTRIIVLGLRQNKFNEKFKEVQDTINHNFVSIQTDLGFTEVEKGTITAFGFIKE